MKKQKLKVGITGHRDPLESEIPKYSQQMKEYLSKLKKENPDRELILQSPIATGADTIFIRAGIELNLSYDVVLPMDQDLYEIDFNTKELEEFRTLIKGALSITVIPMFDGNNRTNISKYGMERNYQYRAVGRYLSSICNKMVALFDGNMDEIKFGGTGDIVLYMQRNNVNYYCIMCERKSA